MPWWAWLVIGAMLLILELAFVDAQFYLVFLGTAALLVGTLGASGVVTPEWLQWLIFAVLAIASMVLFRGKLYNLLRRHGPDIEYRPTGEQVLVPVELAPGASCRLEYRGSTWTAQNVGRQPITADAQARIVDVDGLTLQIKSIHHS
jgi:inner membrane protein